MMMMDDFTDDLGRITAGDSGTDAVIAGGDMEE